MADNTTLNPGADGDVIAADDIGGVKYQRVKLVHGADGVNSGDAATSNPFPVQVPSGELIEAMQSMRRALDLLVGGIGLSIPDVLGRLRVSAELAAGQTLATVTTVTTATTVGTVTNQTNIGTFPANPQIPSLMSIGAESLRRNISVT